MQDVSRDYNRKLRRRDGFCYPKDNETSGTARLLYLFVSFINYSIQEEYTKMVNVKCDQIIKIKRKSVPLYGVSSQNV